MILLAVFGLVITTILVVRNVRGAILIGIVVTTLLGIPMGSRFAAFNDTAGNRR
jgi:AGZA family xanthine/uracil permease-like MFS transporter